MRTGRAARHRWPLGLAVLLLAGCGGSSSLGPVQSHPAPPASSFPAPNGRSLAQVLSKAATGPRDLLLIPQSTAFYPGVNRYGFGVFTPSSRKQVPDAQVALYVAKSVPPGKVPQAKQNGASTGKGPLSRLNAQLGNEAHGPYPARVESLETKPEFRSQTTAEDPDAGRVLYVANVDFPTAGEWRIGALIRQGGKVTTHIFTPANVGEFKQIPRVGEKAPRIHTPTPQSVGGDLSKLTTRVPPEHMNQRDFYEVLGKKPIVLLFATPKFCQSRVCGPAVDAAAQVQKAVGSKVQFIHMEIYEDNDPNKGVRPQVRAYHLPTEPWLFVIDRKGVIRTVIEGAFSPRELAAAVKGVTS